MFVAAFASFFALVTGVMVGMAISEKSLKDQQAILYNAYLEEMYKRLASERQFRDNQIAGTKPRNNKVTIIGRAP